MIKKILSNIKENKSIYITFLCFGLFIGALMVDFAGLGKGNISLDYLSGDVGAMFRAGEKTWVSYDNPVVEMTVLNDLSCEYCDPSESVNAIKQNISPTIAVNDIDINSLGGKTLIDLFNVRIIPAFVFSKEVEQVIGFSNIEHLFQRKGAYYLLDPVKVGMEPFRVLNLPKSDSKVTIIEISDYQCPYCKKAAMALDEAISGYPEEDVLVIFRHLPLDFHEFAEDAAAAAECARKQNKFHEMSSLLFESQFNSTSDIEKIAKSITGLDYDVFEKCILYGEAQDIIDYDKKWTADLGISGTPTFIINGRYISGAKTAEEFSKIIDEELEKS